MKFVYFYIYFNMYFFVVLKILVKLKYVNEEIKICNVRF